VEERSDGTILVSAPLHGVGGYLWSAVTLNSRSIVHEHSPEVNSGSVGGGATARFLVEPVADGNIRISLTLKQPFASRSAKREIIEIARPKSGSKS
jgi:hypothetical protein